MTSSSLDARASLLRLSRRTLDRARRNLSNYVVLKSAIDRQANELVGRGPGRRHEFSRDELDRIEADFDGVVVRAVAEVFGG